MSPRPFLIIEKDVTRDQLIPALQKHLETSDVASVLVKAVDGAELKTKTATLLPFCHTHNIAILIADRPELVTALGVDGVHIMGDEKSIHQARQTLGKEAIIGADAGLSRHQAMLLGEAGADYIAFSGEKAGAVEDICAWWAPLFQIPCVALFKTTPKTINDNAHIDFYGVKISA